MRHNGELPHRRADKRSCHLQLRLSTESQPDQFTAIFRAPTMSLRLAFILIMTVSNATGHLSAVQNANQLLPTKSVRSTQINCFVFSCFNSFFV